MEKEFDFSIETENMTDCRKFFSENPSVYVPKPYLKYCTKHIVVMEYMDGVKVNDVDALDKMGFDHAEVGKLCVSAFSDMIFRFNKLHVDPHPGNLLIRPQPGNESHPQLIILDHGMYLKFNESFSENFRKLWLAMITQNREEVRKYCEPWGLQDNAEMLTMMFTGRSTMMQNK
jgi:aarF domain-containing kinase